MDYSKIKLTKYRPKSMRIDKPMILIGKTGLRFNVACGKYVNRHYKYCEIYYDKTEMVVAIKPTNELSESSLKICRSIKNSPFVCARDFLKRMGIKERLGLSDDFKSIRVLPTWNEKARMFFLDLKPFIK
jgi:hypothetical protein